MITDVQGGDLISAISRLQKLGAVFTVKTAPPKATKVDEEPLASISEAAAEKRPEIEGLVRDIIKALVGDHAKVEFSADLMPLAGTSGGWGAMAENSPGARGLYYPARHLIKLALIHGVDSAAFHEAYHAIEYQLQSPQERALMERETGRQQRATSRTGPAATLDRKRRADARPLRAHADGCSRGTLHRDRQPAGRLIANARAGANHHHSQERTFKVSAPHASLRPLWWRVAYHRRR
jgi:hypothetical protein